MGLRQVRCTNLSLAQAKGRCEHRAIKQTCCHARVCRKRGSSPFARARAHAHTWRSPVAGALTINVGDMLQVYSNDRYVAPLHRVLANREKHRYSAPFFFNPVSPPAPPVAPAARRPRGRWTATRQLGNSPGSSLTCAACPRICWGGGWGGLWCTAMLTATRGECAAVLGRLPSALHPRHARLRHWCPPFPLARMHHACVTHAQLP